MTFLGVFWLKKVQFFVFYSISLRLKFLKVDEGLLQEKIAGYGHF